MEAALRIAGRRLISAQRPQAALVYKAVVSPLVGEARRRILPSLLRGSRQPGFSPLRSMSSAPFRGAESADADIPNFQPPSSAERDADQPDSEVDPEGAWAYRRILEIEIKKHELFYLVADMIKKYPGNKYAKINNELPHNLFPHIVPNPENPIWRYARMKERINSSLVYGIPTMMGAWMYLDWDGWKDMFIYLLSQT